jgi:hypothetical protein
MHEDWCGKPETDAADVHPVPNVHQFSEHRELAAPGSECAATPSPDCTRPGWCVCEPFAPGPCRWLTDRGSAKVGTVMVKGTDEWHELNLKQLLDQEYARGYRQAQKPS